MSQGGELGVGHWRITDCGAVHHKIASPFMTLCGLRFRTLWIEAERRACKNCTRLLELDGERPIAAERK